MGSSDSGTQSLSLTFSIMKTAIRTDDEFIIIKWHEGNVLATYSARSKAHTEMLLEVVGKNVLDLLAFNVGKEIDVQTLEVIE